jgi:hypothetical protein
MGNRRNYARGFVTSASIRTRDMKRRSTTLWCEWMSAAFTLQRGRQADPSVTLSNPSDPLGVSAPALVYLPRLAAHKPAHWRALGKSFSLGTTRPTSFSARRLEIRGSTWP